MKKSISLILVLAMVFCMALTGFAMSGPTGKITGMTGDLSLGYSGPGDLGEVYPQDERMEYIYLYDSMFSWDDDYVPQSTPSQLSTSQIRTARLEARTSRSTSKVVESIAINAKESRIEIKFAKEYIGTRKLDFEFDVVLSVDGRRQSDHAMSFTGTFLNASIDVYDGYEDVDISDGTVAVAQEYLSKLDVFIGHGITVATRLSNGKAVYGTTTMTPTSHDEEIMKEYPGISEAITLRTVGFPSSSKVKMGPEYTTYHVYDKDLNYLGKGKDTLDISDKYYLSTKELDLDFQEPSEAPSEASKPVGGVGNAANLEPGNQSPPNANYNPGTGR